LNAEITDKINECRQAKDSGDLEAMKARHEELSKVLMKIGEAIYSQQQSQSSSSEETVDGDSEKKDEK